MLILITPRQPTPRKKRIHPVLWLVFAVILVCAYLKDEANLKAKNAGNTAQPAVYRPAATPGLLPPDCVR